MLTPFVRPASGEGYSVPPRCDVWLDDSPPKVTWCGRPAVLTVDPYGNRGGKFLCVEHALMAIGAMSRIVVASTEEG